MDKPDDKAAVGYELWKSDIHECSSPLTLEKILEAARMVATRGHLPREEIISYREYLERLNKYRPSKKKKGIK